MATEQEGTIAQRRWLATIGVVLYVVASVFSHRFDYAAIVDLHPFFNMMHLADPQLLQHHLIPTLWNLQMQPPLFNVEIGLLLHLPQTLGCLLMRLVCGGLYVATGLWTFKAMTRLRVGARTAMTATVVLVYCDPAQLFFAQSVFYAGATSALATGIAYFSVRFVQEPTPRNGAWFSGMGAMLCLYVTFLQPVVFLVMLGVVWCIYPPARHGLKKGAILPVAILLLVVLKSLVMFHTPTTSTWAGMNLARVTTDLATQATIERLSNSHDFSSNIRVKPFSSLEQYGVDPKVGNTVRTQIVKSTGQINYNNDAYRQVASKSMSDSLQFIKHEPRQYFNHVLRGLSIWSLPSDQYFLCPVPQSGLLGSYANFYDSVVGGQIRPLRNLESQVKLGYSGVPWPSRSPLALLSTLAALAGGFLLIVKRWRQRRDLGVALAVPWLFLVVGFSIMNATDVGENQRFRFQLGTALITLAVVVVTNGGRSIQRRIRSTH